jgi:hypothetical protein
MAAAHLLTMRMAAAADRAIGAAQGDANFPLFDLAAARFAAAAARLNGRYGRGLQTLRALGSAAGDDDVEWVGVTLPVFGEEKLSPAEKARRINREKFYRRRDQAEPESEPEAAARRRSLDAGEQAALAAAGGAARNLLSATGVEALAGSTSAAQTKLFSHQLAAAHRLMMRLSGRADAVVAADDDPLDRPEGLRLAHGAARLMERFRQGVAMLQRVRTGPGGPRPCQTYWCGPLSDWEREEERLEDIAAGLDPDTGLPVEAPRGMKADLPASIPASAVAATLASAKAGRPVLLSRGRLNNGNPGGDFLAAPRCGARTRAGSSCRQPAMANGRCRFHGGKSTGPRTEAGRARVRSNRLVHGLRSAEMIALSAAAAASHRRLGLLLGASAKKIRRRAHGDHTDGSSSLARAARNDPSSSSGRSVSSVANPFHLVDPFPAGHGVDRSESNLAAGGATILPFTRPALLRSPCRNRLPRVRS